MPGAEPKVPQTPIKPKEPAQALTLAGVLENIRNPNKWIEHEALVQLITENPSLRGMTYGYVAEAAFIKFLENLGINEHFKPDDHEKTKSDRTFNLKGRQYTLQLKSLQTNSIKEAGLGQFRAKVQNDASDARRITLPNHEQITTTCYQVGEYDVLGVGLQPFAGEWRFAFKKNKDLKRTTSKKYTVEAQKMLLATLEDISFPLTADWTEDLLSLLTDLDLGKVL
ncbi:MAG: hypothetical protein ACRD2P_09715 [Terriglobia bacterium]